MKNNVKTPSEVVSILADRWGAIWSEETEKLLFGNNERHVAIAMEPASIKAFASELNKTIQQFEARHGVLWSEKSAQAARQNDRALFRTEQAMDEVLRCEFPTSNTAANKLYLCIRNLQLEGWERSIKLLPNTMLAERFLAGMPLSAIAPEDLIYLAEKLAAPEAFLHAIRTELDKACYLHIGFEQGTTNSIYKLYLEYPASSSAPLYIGYKWDAEQPEYHALTYYSKPRSLSLPQMHANITQAFVHQGMGAEKAAHAIIDIAVARLSNEAVDQLLFVEVSDTDSPRRSFDINLYESGLRVGDVLEQLGILAHTFSVPDSAFEQLTNTISEDLLGHISGGMDRNGQPFFTLYYAQAQ